jgi:hypothetical protein
MMDHMKIDSPVQSKASIAGDRFPQLILTAMLTIGGTKLHPISRQHFQHRIRVSINGRVQDTTSVQIAVWRNVSPPPCQAKPKRRARANDHQKLQESKRLVIVKGRLFPIEAF